MTAAESRFETARTGRPQGRVLIIAGSDSGGGAGIQADIKTVTALGEFAMTALTAVTVQDTLGVHGVQPMDPHIIRGQITSALADLGADVVKTGMLGDADTIETVAQALAKADFQGMLVVDPVMVATSGARLLDSDAAEVLIRRLVARADLVTPNMPEAAVLTGRTVASREDMEAAGRDIVKMGAGAVLMKGGHGDADTVVDLLVTADGVAEHVSPRQTSTSTHGTGCTLASAVAARLSAGVPLDRAWRDGIAYVQAAMAAAPGFGAGHGPLGHGRVRLADDWPHGSGQGGPAVSVSSGG
ncbi:bifunctional hydroxymethylpyrimidine kinase/phosphomethylpyrimidine kinase [Yunchengibacter salinarum]|uniref:bifunctional hydroxymethylpyrimidine kinase/phosphomethylpyrimidine kinase n=1 Tax=Yunchengibacter salinarum TaxID=3133399 RepID=UPI0035B69A38